MKFTAHEHATFTQTHKADSWAAATNLSAAVDTVGFNELLLIVNVGTSTATGSMVVTLQDSAATGGTYADVTGTAMTAVTTANDDNQYIGRVNLRGVKRFVKVEMVNTTDACEASTTVMLSHPEVTPVTQVSTLEFNISNE